MKLRQLVPQHKRLSNEPESMHVRSIILGMLCLFLGQSARSQGQFYLSEDLNNLTSITAAGQGLWHEGKYYNFYTKDKNGGHQPVISCYAESGNLLWTKAIELANSAHARKIITSNDGQLLIAGQLTYNGSESPYLAKLDDTAKVLWSKVYPMTGGQMVDELLQLNSGRIVLIGANNQWEFSSSPKGVFSLFCQFDGSVLNYQFLPISRNFVRLESALIMDNGDVMASGSYGHAQEYMSGLVMRFSSGGNLIWAKHYRVDLPGGVYQMTNQSTSTALYFHDMVALGNDRYWLLASYSDHNYFGLNYSFHRPTLIELDGSGTVQSGIYYNTKLRAWKIKESRQQSFLVSGFYEPTREGCLMEIQAGGTMQSRISWNASSADVRITWDITQAPDNSVFLPVGLYNNGNWKNGLIHDNKTLSNACDREVQSSLSSISVSPTARALNVTPQGNVSAVAINAQTACNCHSWEQFCGAIALSGWLTAEDSVCVGEMIHCQINDLQLENSCVDYQLDFGDGTVQEASDTAHIYSNAGTYTLKLMMTQTGCGTQLLDSIRIKVNTFGRYELEDTAFCSDAAIYFRIPQAPGSVYWVDQGVIDSVLVSSSGAYPFQITNSGCSLIDTIQIDLIGYSPSLADTLWLCQEESTQLIIQDSIAGIQWNDGFTGASRTVDQSASLSVTISKGQCNFMESVEVIKDSAFVELITASSQFCEDDSVEVSATWFGDSLNWHDTYQGNSRWITEPVKVKVLVYSGHCRDSAEKAFERIRWGPLSDTFFLCSGEEQQVTIIHQQDSIRWDDGDKQSTRTLDRDGLFTYTVYRAHCSAKGSILIRKDSGGITHRTRDPRFCEGDSGILEVGYWGDSLVWQDGFPINPRTVYTSGIYPFVVHSTFCSYSDTFQARMDSMPVADLGPDRNICGNQAIKLTSKWPNAVHEWSTGSNRNEVTVDQEGWYWIREKNGSCEFTDSVYLTEFNMDLGPDQITCDSLPDRITAYFGADSYQWNTGSTDSLVVVDVQGGTYVLTVSKGNCQLTDSVIYFRQGIPDVFIPNVFTPNEDGYNDHFLIRFDQEVVDFNLEIFNRHSQRVYREADQNFKWDGTSTLTGDALPAGVYFVILEFRHACSGKKESYSGTLTLIR